MQTSILPLVLRCRTEELRVLAEPGRRLSFERTPSARLLPAETNQTIRTRLLVPEIETHKPKFRFPDPVVGNLEGKV